METKNFASSSEYSRPSKEQVLACFEDPHIKGTFSEVKEIGHGGYGTVYSVKHNHDKKYYALKIIQLYTGDDEEKLKTEVEVLAKISEHENIVGYNNSWTLQCDMNQNEQKPKCQSSATTEVKESCQNDPCVTASGISSTASHARVTSSTDQYELTGKIFVIQMEYCEQTLRQFIDREKPSPSKTEDIERILRDILSGMRHFHSKKVIHRDLTPNNIFLDTFGKAKIGDFGLAKFMESDTIHDHDRMNAEEQYGLKSCTDGVGTYLYRAPEISPLQHGKVKYDYRVDLYSLGVIMFEMHYLFHTHQERCHVLESLRKDLVLPKDFEEKMEGNPEVYKRIILGLMDKNPHHRYSLERVEALLPLGCSDIITEDSTGTTRSRVDSQRMAEVTVPDDEDLTSLTASVGICKWSNGRLNSNSLCFPVGKNQILTVLPKHLNSEQLRHCKVIFPRTKINGLPLRYNWNAVTIVWKSDSQKYGQRIVIRLKLRRDTHFPFESPPVEKLCLHSGEKNFFYFNKTSSRFLRIHPVKLGDILKKESDISSENMFFFDIQTSNSNIGAPVMRIGDDQIIRSVGIITKSVYQKGNKIGTVFAGLTDLPEKILKCPISVRKTSETLCCRECIIDILREENEHLKKTVIELEEKLKQSNNENRKLKSEKEVMYHRSSSMEDEVPGFNIKEDSVIYMEIPTELFHLFQAGLSDNEGP